MPSAVRRNDVDKPIHSDIQILLVCKGFSDQATSSFLHEAMFIYHYTACPEKLYQICLHSVRTIAPAKYLKRIRRFSTARFELLLFLGLMTVDDEMGFVAQQDREWLPGGNTLRELDFKYELDPEIQTQRLELPFIGIRAFRILTGIIRMLHDRKDFKPTLTFGLREFVPWPRQPTDQKMMCFEFRINPDHSVEIIEWPRKGGSFSTASLKPLLEFFKVELADEDVERMRAINGW